MKSAMRRIFGDCERQVVGTNSSEIKEEPVYLTSARQKPKGFYQKNADQRGRPYSKGPKQQGRNPLGKDGRITRCSYCGSLNHCYRNCPDRDTNGGETVDVVESVDIVEAGCNKSAIVLYNRSDVDTSTKNRGFLDTACTSSVCGDPWISRFIASLPETARKRVKKIDTQTKFVFGDGKSSWSKYKIRLPVEICTVRCFIVNDVIDGNLPLLFSKSAMKRMKAVIDTINDTVTVFDQKTANEMLITQSGHYALDLTFTERGKWSEQTECEESVLAVKSTELTEMDLEKLHVQFAHCSSEKLLTLLKNAGYECGSLAHRQQEMCKKCKICIGNSRNRPRPKVGLPLARKFNDVVAMDFHQLSFKGNLWFLHIIDEFSRLSEAVIINSKSSENIISSLVKYWILRFGPPRGIHVDNGREFNNGELRNLCQRHGIRIFPTTPYSPGATGCVKGIMELYRRCFIKLWLKIRIWHWI